MRRHGLGAIHKQKQQNALYKEKSEELAKEQINRLTDQLDKFKLNLEEFASKHQKEIKKNAEFRRQFQEMCAHIGVDPLQSSNSYWSKLLGVGDFYYQLGIQIIEICLATSKSNGGIIRLPDLLNRIKQIRKRSLKADREEIEITANDIISAISKLHILGNGLKLVKIDPQKSNLNNYVIESVPRELSQDDQDILQIAETNNGQFDFKLIYGKFAWSEDRFKRKVDHLLMEGLVWFDKCDRTYWFIGLFVK